jgi:tRNA pseudouridine38-40 synthase
MPRHFIELAYKGTDFHGWQTQDNAVTVQQELNNALSTLLRAPIETLGCGRTDTGVHASQFFAHFDSEIETDEKNKLTHRLNALLSPHITVYKIYDVDENAHARFDATHRSYGYYICREKNPYLQELTWYWDQQIDIELMNRGAQILLIHDDFGCFSKSGGQQYTNICKITEALWTEEGNLLKYSVTANRFLRGMVRAMAGTLLDLGLNKINLNDFDAILKSGDRTKAGQAVPAKGLFLEEIRYPYLHTSRRYPFQP